MDGKPVGIEKTDPAYEEAKKAMKASQKEFAKTLASYADVYVNDAFGTAHHNHAHLIRINRYADAYCFLAIAVVDCEADELLDSEL